MFLVDAGDALSAAHALVPARREGALATAKFIVEQYTAQHLDVLALGDRDLGLGRQALSELAGAATFPFVATNVFEVGGDKPAFADRALIARDGMTVLFLGLVSPSSARAAERTLSEDKLRVGDPVAAVKAVLAGTKADLVVVLSQLTPNEERELADAVPEVRMILGGDAMGARPSLESVGRALGAEGSQKGKHIGIVTVTLDAPGGLAGNLVDPTRRVQLERRKADAERRVASLEKRLADAKARAPTAGPPPPLEVYERQLAGARAELQLAQSGLEDASTSVPAGGNPVQFELVEMGTNVADEPSVKALVDAFRVKFPDPNKPPPAPPGTPVPPGAPIHGPH